MIGAGPIGALPLGGYCFLASGNVSNPVTAFGWKGCYPTVMVTY